MCLSHTSCGQMKVGLPVSSLLVEFAMHGTQHRNTGDTSTEKLVPNPVDKGFGTKTEEWRFGAYPIFVHQRDQVEVRRGG